MRKGSKIRTVESRNSVEKQYDTISNEEEGEEDSSSRRNIGITVTAEWIENLDACKVKEITLKMEYKGNVLVISDPIPVKNSKVDIDLSGIITVEDEVNVQFLDDMLSNPVLFTVMNSGAQIVAITTPPKPEKDPRKKTAKVPETPSTAVKPTSNGQNILGICNLDISGLILGKRTVRECLPVDSDIKVPPMEVATWTKLPKLWVSATTEYWEIFDEAAKKIDNILEITIESIYNIPAYILDGTVFEAKVLAPSLGNRSNIIAFPGGVVTVPVESNLKKKWLNLSQVEGSGARSNRCISPEVSDVINTLEDCQDIEGSVKKLKPIIQWNTWRSVLMTRSDTNYFYSKLIKYRVWPVEISSNSRTKEPAQKSAKSEKKVKIAPFVTTTGREHFIAFLNLSAFFYPGVTKARVAAQLYTYSASDLVEKFGAELPDTLPRPSVGNVKTKVASKNSVREIEEYRDSGLSVFATDGSPMFIIVDIELRTPLVPKQEPDGLLKTLKDYLSIKRAPQKKLISSEQAEENFSSAVKDMVSILSQEYEMFCQDINDNTKNTDDCSIGFEEYLCRRENFYKMQATLERKAVELITEKFGPMSQWNDLPDMYIYLVEKMHKITNQCQLKQEVASTIFNIDDYQLYAEEAIEEEEYELAKEYLFQKLSLKITNPDYWLDCAVYFNTLNQTEHAIEAVREALYLDISHQIGLLMYALLMEKIGNGGVAELTFQVLVTKYPDYLEGWLAFWLYFTVSGIPEGRFIALRTAKTLNCELKVQTKEENGDDDEMKEEDEEKGEENGEEEEEEMNLSNHGYIKSNPPENKYLVGDSKYGIGSFRNGQTLSEPLSWTSRFPPLSCIYVRMAKLLMRLGFYEYAYLCLKQLKPPRKDNITNQYFLYYEAVNNYLLGRYYDAIPRLKFFVKDYGKDPFVWSLMGHCYYKLQNHAQAIACYEYVIESFNRPDDLHLIYLRMGYYYLKAEKYPCAKKTLLTACKYSPSPKLWKGIGIACLRMEEGEEAEIAFSEANYLDNNDPETWAYLALTNCFLGRLHLFKNCYTEAKKRNLRNQELIHEVQSCALLNGLEEEDFRIF